MKIDTPSRPREGSSIFSHVEREAWQEYERRKRRLLAEMDAGKLEYEAYEYLVQELAAGMGI